MLILALESSAKAASVALMEDEKLIAQYSQCSGLTHSRTLLPMVDDMLKNTENTVAGVILSPLLTDRVPSRGSESVFPPLRVLHGQPIRCASAFLRLRRWRGTECPQAVLSARSWMRAAVRCITRCLK